jgi:hypothetical protein
VPVRSSGQQSSVDDVGGSHLAIWLKYGDVLIYWTTAVGVVHGIARDGFSVAIPEVIDFGNSLPLLSNVFMLSPIMLLTCFICAASVWPS